MGRSLLLGIGLLFGLLAFNAGLVYFNARNIYHNAARVEHTYEVLLAIEELLSSVKDAETGQRGYVITGADHYLEPYHGELLLIPRKLERIRELTADNPHQQALLPRLEELVQARQDRLARTIALRRQSGFEAARDNVLTDDGLRSMVAMRSLVDDLQREELRLLAQRNKAALSSHRFGILNNTIASVAALAGVMVVYWLLRRHVAALAQLNTDLDRRVDERTRELERTQVKLLRSERQAVMGQLAGGVAHEIRNPLHVISTSLYYLRMTQPNLPAKPREHLDRIDHHVAVASRIVAELLDYARMPQSQPEVFPLWQTLEHAMAGFTVPAAVRVAMAPPDAPVFVHADRGQLQRIAENYLRNALQAMPDGGELSLRVSARNGCAVAEVADTGTGIAPENLSQIFEPLFTTKVKGIGLGLAISKIYAEMQGGKLEVESELGHGAAFRLVLPLECSAAGTPAPRSV